MRWLETPAQDVAHAVRALRKSPSFTVVAVLTLAVGIGVNVAIFSLTEQILLRPLPVAEPDRLVNLSDPGPKLDPKNGPGGAMTSVAGDQADTIFSYPMFRDLERAQEAFVGIVAHRIFDASLSTGDQARLETGTFVSGNYFSVLGLQPALGRLLGPQDDTVDGQAESVVLSHAYWQREFAGDPDILGRRLIVNGEMLTVVGVAPPEFHSTTVGVRPSVFVPITFRSDGVVPNHDSRGIHWVHLFARLGPEVTREQAAATINPLYRRIVNEIEAPLQEEAKLDEAFRMRSLLLESGAHGQSALRGPARERLQMLLAVSGIVLLLCCANVAGLMLVRGSARTGEMAVRASMGATRARLASLLLAEALLLALPAALVSLPVALLSLRGIGSAVPAIRTGPLSTFEPAAAFDVTLSFSAALVAVGVAIVSALAFGLLPVRGVMRNDPARTLQVYGARQTSSRHVMRFRTGLATAQIALSMALLAMTGVFAQSLWNSARTDLGLDVDSLVTFSISPATSGYSAEASANLLDRLNQELNAIPGVTSVASSSAPLLSGRENGLLIRGIQGVDVEESVAFNSVSPGFFQTLGIDLLAGRDFSATDAPGGQGVAIVNRRFAERFGLDAGAVGAQLRFTTRRGENVEIIGVVADAKYGDVTDEVGPQLFQPLPNGSTFYVRGARRPEDLANAVRETAARVDPIVPMIDLRTMAQQVRENLGTQRFIAAASTALAVLATMLAGLGLFGVLAYSVAQRSREIGLRVALGAAPGRIHGMVLQRVAIMMLGGISLGIAAAFLLGRAARSLLFGVEAGDPVAIIGAAAILTAVTLAAAYLPARRASRVDPMSVLRYE